MSVRAGSPKAPAASPIQRKRPGRLAVRGGFGETDKCSATRSYTRSSSISGTIAVAARGAAVVSGRDGRVPVARRARREDEDVDARCRGGERLPAMPHSSRMRRSSRTRFGQAVSAFLGYEYGEGIVVRALAEIRQRRHRTVGRDHGRREAALTTRWHASMRALAAERSARRPSRRRGHLRSANATVAASEHRTGAQPRRRYIMFLSERDRYSVDVFLADARTGELVRKIVSTAVNGISIACSSSSRPAPGTQKARASSLRRYATAIRS